MCTASIEKLSSIFPYSAAIRDHVGGTQLHVKDLTAGLRKQYDIVVAAGLTGKRACARMKNKRIVTHHMPPSGFQRTVAKIIFFPVCESTVGLGHLVHILFAFESTACLIQIRP
mgnify:CR=1 FL=1